MADENQLDQTIADAATAPASASSDGQSVQAVKIDDLVKADEYLNAKDATRRTGKGWGGIMSKRIPPGAV